MIIGYPDGDWIIKLGPVTKTNHAGSQKQAEEGATQKVLDSVKEIMGKARELAPLVQANAVAGHATCVSGCELTIKEEIPDPQVLSFQLPDGKWFSIATSKTFGMKLISQNGQPQTTEVEKENTDEFARK